MWEEYEITPNNALQYRKEELTDRQTDQKSMFFVSKTRSVSLVPSMSMRSRITKIFLNVIHFLSAQYEDIVKAEETLEGIIQELDEGMRKQFTEKFRRYPEGI